MTTPDPLIAPPAISRAIADTKTRAGVQTIRELEAMAVICEALATLDGIQSRSRVLRCASSRYGCDDD